MASLERGAFTPERTMEHTTTAVAASAVTTPFWLPWLQTASETAATIAPILGLVWLIIQIFSKTIETYQRMRDRKNED
ncbi:hypothetical protein GOC60_04785 [Sinorhizobium meliloti]|nr:hypothetical protein [Sinorhizobium meliloti]MDX0347779.1 hypothetical protein [Sinorhizobium meliloti]